MRIKVTNKGNLGDAKDFPMPFSTLEEDTAEENSSIINTDDGNGTAHRVGENLKIEEEITADVLEETAVSESVSDKKTSNGLIYGIGGVIFAGIAVLAGVLIKKKRG